MRSRGRQDHPAWALTTWSRRGLTSVNRLPSYESSASFRAGVGRLGFPSAPGGKDPSSRVRAPGEHWSVMPATSAPNELRFIPALGPEQGGVERTGKNRVFEPDAEIVARITAV